jgi:hypothetical protein
MATSHLGPVEEAVANRATMAELAAWTVLTNALLNVDEIFTR